MIFEWNERKSRINKAKHGISFELAVRIWLDQNHGELRWIAIGRVDGQMMLMAVHTYLEDEEQEIVRIISARRATTHERRRYQKGNVA